MKFPPRQPAGHEFVSVSYDAVADEYVFTRDDGHTTAPLSVFGAIGTRLRVSQISSTWFLSTISMGVVDRCQAQIF